MGYTASRVATTIADLASTRILQDGANEQHQSISTIYQLSAGDYVELVVYQDAGLGGTSVQMLNGSSSNFGMTWTGPGVS